MKIGIMTFINTTNFGASLQAYALQEAVDACGHRAEIIRYTSPAIERQEKNTGKPSVKRMAKQLMVGGEMQKKAAAFRAFEQAHFRYGMELTDENTDAVSDAYDAFLAGSDQVWNAGMTRGDWRFFLDFVRDKNKRLSYAPSFGDKPMPEAYSEKLGKLLRGFGALSVREASGAERIAALSGRSAEVVLDPTLLLTKEQWEERVSFKPDHAPYILVYLPRNKKAVFSFAEKLKQKTGLPVVYLSISPRPQSGVETIVSASPEEFVGWIRHASYVITASFHGASFALNLEKQVFFDTLKEGGRVDNLVGICGLRDRMIGVDGVMEREIDYTEPRKCLGTVRERSLAWLKNTLAAAERGDFADTAVTVPVSEDECCGCAGCVSVCPTAAITMQRDARGFAYPVVDESKCVRCGLCRRTCAFFNHQKSGGSMTTVTVAKHRDLGVRMDSQSGGMFVAMSDWILDNGGTVYGCVLDESLRAVHIRAADRATRDRMCGSKYVQSDTSGIFDDIRRDLESGLPVLLTGTACQTDGIKKALEAKRVDTGRLYVVDIICHGCPSPLIYEDFIGYLGKKYGAAPENFNFRDKRATGWDGHRESYYINGKKHVTMTYKEIFYGGGCLRPSCFHCHYTEICRESDITIGDAWGVKKAKPEINDNRGLSVTLVHSEKGRELLEQIKKVCDTTEMPLEKLMQRNLRAPTKPDRDPERFWHTYREKGIDGVVAAYGTLAPPKKLKINGKRQLRRLLLSRKYYLGEKEVKKS